MDKKWKRKSIKIVWNFFSREEKPNGMLAIFADTIQL